VPINNKQTGRIPVLTVEAVSTVEGRGKESGKAHRVVSGAL